MAFLIADSVDSILKGSLPVRVAATLYLTGCLTLSCFLSWSLLTPDPFGIVRQSSLAWTEHLSDLMTHAAAFAALSAAWLGLFSLRRREPSLLALMLMLGYCLCIESLQTFVPGRHCCTLDALANIVGFLMGLLAVRMLAWQIPSRSAVG